ncbi:hypothetical protein AGMMS50268_15740 [Spirochaetia bacterium]|nr:hypothetical protein AGMMS50268_15740 [Spirochaetia bacterium]
MDKWLTDLTVEELKAKILPKPHKPYEIDGMPVFMNMDAKLLPEEIFKKHPELSVEVSNLGRIRYNGAILLQMPDADKDDPYGYLRVAIIRGVIESCFVYRFVAETWCDRPNSVYNTVHHISNNGMDNRASNLLWVTPGQHREIHLITIA